MNPDLSGFQVSWHAFIGDGGDNGTTLNQILPRGWAISHFAKYGKETGRVGLTVTGDNAANVNQTDQRPTGATDARWVRAKMHAYVTLNEDFYSKVPVEDRHRFWRTDPSLNADPNLGVVNFDSSKISAISTPTNNSGANGTDMGIIKIDLPTGFKIGKATAMRSTSDARSKTEAVTVGADGSSAFVTLPVSNILSVRFEK